MRRYEMALVATPTLSEDEHDKRITAFETMIADMGGNVLKVDRWGRRKLAYPIAKQTEGNYTFLLFDAEPDVEKEFLRRLQLSEDFLRYQSVRADDEKPPTDEEKEALAAQRAEIIKKAAERAAAEAAGLDPDALDDESDEQSEDDDDRYDRDDRDDDDDDDRPARAKAPSKAPAKKPADDSSDESSDAETAEEEEKA
jgi:small subunit ribosomal protein S6